MPPSLLNICSLKRVFYDRNYILKNTKFIENILLFTVNDKKVYSLVFDRGWSPYRSFPDGRVVSKFVFKCGAYITRSLRYHYYYYSSFVTELFMVGPRACIAKSSKDSLFLSLPIILYLQSSTCHFFNIPQRFKPNTNYRKWRLSRSRE